MHDSKPVIFVIFMQVCYSWWCLSALSILGRLHWIDRPALTAFILDCQVCARAEGAAGHLVPCVRQEGRGRGREGAGKRAEGAFGEACSCCEGLSAIICSHLTQTHPQHPPMPAHVWLHSG